LSSLFCRLSVKYRGENSKKKYNWFVNCLRHQITPAKLDELEQNGHFCILANHLNVQNMRLEEEDIYAIRLLAERFHQRKTILVTRTSRLLSYAVTQRYLKYQWIELDDIFIIRVVSINDPVTGSRVPEPHEIKGITFYTENPDKTVVFIVDKQIPPDDLQRNIEDSTGRKSVSISWFAKDTFDYTQIAE